MIFIKWPLIILLSVGSVFLQKYLPFSQWLSIYAMVFFISWFGGLIPGMVSTALSLGFAGWYLVPHGAFDVVMLLELLGLMILGFWISYSMDQYRYSGLKLTSNEEAAKSFGFLDTLLENLPLMVFVKDAKDLRFVRFNKAGLDLIGVNKEDLIGKNDFDMFPVEEAKHFTEFDREVLRGRGIVDIPNEVISTRNLGQRTLHTKKIPILDKDGTPIYLLGVSEDITERIEADEFKIKNLALDAVRSERLKIQEKEIFIANAISTLSTNLNYDETLRRIASLVVPALGDWSSVTLLNDDGVFVRVASVHSNPELQPLMDEFTKNYPPDKQDVELTRTLKEGISTLGRDLDDGLIRLRSQDERKYKLYHLMGTASSLVVPIKYRDKILGALSVVRGSERPRLDDLDLAMAEEIGRRAGAVLENSLLFKSTEKAVRARDEFLSIASHELKTPITSLKLQLQMLQRSQENQKIMKPLTKAINQVDRLTLLVNDLLDVSKFESGKMTYHFQKFDISSLAHEVCDYFRQQIQAKSVELRLDIQGEIQVTGDRHRVEQVFNNLLSNAFKYGDEKPIDFKLVQTESHVVISIKDHGKGISAENQRKIFNKFERGAQDPNISGLGLGLFISHEIVVAHNGRIEIQSMEGMGSEFKVILPIA